MIFFLSGFLNRIKRNRTINLYINLMFWIVAVFQRCY